MQVKMQLQKTLIVSAPKYLVIFLQINKKNIVYIESSELLCVTILWLNINPLWYIICNPEQYPPQEVMRK